MEDNVRSQVTVNELFFRVQRPQPARDPSDGRQRSKRSEASEVPGSPVSLGEYIRSRRKEPGYGNTCGRAMELLPSPADLGPVPREVLAFEAPPSDPAINGQAPVWGTHGSGQTKPGFANVVENLFLPHHLLTRHAEGPQHKLSCTPCCPLTARKWLERLIDAEGSQKLAGWAGVHRTTIR